MQKLLAQIMKFGVVGVIATVIDFGIMNLLHYGLGLNILIANTSGFIISLIFNYLASMKYVFAHKEGMSRRREFIIFVVLSVIGLVLNDGIVLALNAVADFLVIDRSGPGNNCEETAITPAVQLTLPTASA